MERAVVYVRVSTSEQVNNYSLDTQVQACTDFCKREGIEVVKVFREEGESATNAERTQLLSLLNFCATEAKRLGITLLLVHRVDRLARAVGDHAAIRQALLKVGVRVRAVQENFDDTPTGRFMENLMASLAQFDNDVRAARTRDGMLAALQQGRWVWQPPLGYRRPPGGCGSPSMAPDPDTASKVQIAFELASSGLSRPEILRRLDALGLRSRRGRRLSAQSLGNLLRNELYVGRIVVPKWNFEGLGDFEPLVAPEVFARAQRSTGRGQSGNRRRLDHPDFPLRRAIRCGRCSTPLTGSWSKGRQERYPYYRCPRRGCGLSVRKERLEELFVAELDALTVRHEVFDLLAAVVHDAVRERTAHARRSTEQLQRRLDAVSERQQRVVDAFIQDRVIDRETFEEQRLRFEEERRKIREELDRTVVPELTVVEDATRFARALLTELRACWNRLEGRHKPAFLRAMFPNGLAFGDDGLGTEETPWWVQAFEGSERGSETLAPPTGFEPVSPP